MKEVEVRQERLSEPSAATARLVDRYMKAFERADVEVSAVLTEDVVMEMPRCSTGSPARNYGCSWVGIRKGRNGLVSEASWPTTSPVRRLSERG